MRFLSVLIYILLSVAVGAFLLLLSLSGVIVEPTIIDSLYLTLKSDLLHDIYSRIATLLSGSLLILFAIRHILSGLHKSRKDKAMSFKSDQGNVSVTLFAIEEMIKRMLEERKEISSIRPKVLIRKRGIEINTRAVLNTEVNLIEFTNDIQDQLKMKMHSLLGEDKQIWVNLEIKKVAIGTNSSTGSSTEPEVPFRHYD